MSIDRVPYLDLKEQYRQIEAEMRPRLDEILQSGQYVLGPHVAEFEEDFATYCGVKYSVAVSSGTAALAIALRAAGIEPGDEVILPANTFIATAAAVVEIGAVPVLVDVDPGTRNLDPDRLEAAVTPRTRAVIPVHLYGLVADMEAIREITDRRGLTMIEDAAQAHGARLQGKRAGSFGKAAAFSFYPAKNLGACGEGGAVVTSDSGLASTVRMLRDHGSPKKYEHELVGYNARMDAIQGAVLGIKLKYLDRWNEGRRRVAQVYRAVLKGLPVGLPTEPEGHEPVYHVFAIEAERRDELQSHLAERRVPTVIHYPIPIHLQPAFAFLEQPVGSFPVSERLAKTVLSLPMFPEMTDEQVTFVADRIGEFFD